MIPGYNVISFLNTTISNALNAFNYKEHETFQKAVRHMSLY
jgi:hypothetical protein